MNRIKHVMIAALLFGASGFNSAKAITADELLATIVIPVYQFVIGTFELVGEVLAGHESRIADNETRTTALETADFGSQITGLESRISSLEAEPRANIAAGMPTVIDDINGGFTEGSVWVDVTDKIAYILVDSAPGAAVWKQVTNAKAYSIGDMGPAGGIVFYVTDGGLHGLEAAPVDQSALPGAEWGCAALVTAADGTAIGTGAHNTADILAACGTPGIAARLADAYTLNGFDDWFLPSKDELNELYKNRVGVGGFDNLLYWSSSEFSVNFALGQNFDDGTQGDADKGLPLGVRAVRAF